MINNMLLADWRECLRKLCEEKVKSYAGDKAK